MTKLSSTLPGGDNNGLGILARALTQDPHKTAIIVAVVDCKSITIDTDTGDKVATVRIRRVEPIDPQDTDAAQRLLVRGLEHRTGAVMLPMDLEDELTLLFENLVDSVDLVTGEIVTPEADPEPAGDAVEDTVVADAAPVTTDEVVNGMFPNDDELAAGLAALISEGLPETAPEETPETPEAAEPVKPKRRSRAKKPVKGDTDAGQDPTQPNQ